MKFNKLICPSWMCLAACILGFSQAAVAESDFDDRWYISPSVGVVTFDSDRQLSNGAPYVGIGFGRFFTRNLSLDLRADRYQENLDDVPVGEKSRFRLNSYGVVGRWHFGQDERLRPYFMLATGIQEHRNFTDNGRDIFGSLGLGLNSRLSDRVDLRFEAEGRRDNDRDSFSDRGRGFTDILLTAGLNIRFGQLSSPPPPPADPPARPAPPPPPPAPEPEPEPEPEVLFEFDAMVTFGLDSADLRPGAMAELNEAVALLKLHPEISRIEVAGHTCDLGPARYNEGLSQRRAQSVRDYLVANGVDANRLAVRGYGEDRPKVPNSSESNRQQNRRVELVVLERRDR